MQNIKINKYFFDELLITAKKQPLERFYENLPNFPLCMKSTKVNPYCFQLYKKEAVKHPIVQLNKLWRQYFCFDIDRPKAADAYKNAGLPEPTLSVINTENPKLFFCNQLI